MVPGTPVVILLYNSSTNILLATTVLVLNPGIPHYSYTVVSTKYLVLYVVFGLHEML